MEFKLDDFKMVISILWYDNVNDYDFLRLKNVFQLKIYLGYFFFNHLKPKK
jgi:hypothetical protein